MKFRFIKKVEGEVALYQGKKASTGQTVEFTGFFEQKALKSPDFEVIKRGPKKSGDEKADH